MGRTSTAEAIHKEQRDVTSLAKRFDKSAHRRSTGHTFLILGAALVPAATGGLSFVEPVLAVAVGVVGSVVVLAAQNYNLRAHAESKWQTASELRPLAGDLDALARRAEASGEPDVESVETELRGLRRDREQILGRDRERMSRITPRKLENAGLEKLGITPTGGSQGRS